MINLIDLAVGARILLVGGVSAEVIENMGDGQWVMVRYLDAPGDPASVGTEELCHSQDIVTVVSDGSTGS
jgi:hypothetical protein